MTATTTPTRRPVRRICDWCTDELAGRNHKYCEALANVWDALQPCPACSEPLGVWSHEHCERMMRLLPAIEAYEPGDDFWDLLPPEGDPDEP